MSKIRDGIAKELVKVWKELKSSLVVIEPSRPSEAAADRIFFNPLHTNNQGQQLGDPRMEGMGRGLWPKWSASVCSSVGGFLNIERAGEPSEVVKFLLGPRFSLNTAARVYGSVKRCIDPNQLQLARTTETLAVHDWLLLAGSTPRIAYVSELSPSPKGMLFQVTDGVLFPHVVPKETTLPGLAFAKRVRIISQNHKHMEENPQVKTGQWTVLHWFGQKTVAELAWDPSRLAWNVNGKSYPFFSYRAKWGKKCLLGQADTKLVSKLKRLRAPEEEVRRYLHRMWKLPVEAKLRFFNWLMTQDSVPVGDWLKGPKGVCVLCGLGCVETLEHLFFTCSFAIHIWERTLSTLSKLFTADARIPWPVVKFGDELTLPAVVSSPMVCRGQGGTFKFKGSGDAACSSGTHKDSWHIIRLQVLWAIWTERTHVLFRNKTPEVNNVLAETWTGLVNTLMVEWKKLGKQSDAAARMKFAKAWIRSGVAGTFSEEKVLWKVFPPREIFHE